MKPWIIVFSTFCALLSFVPAKAELVESLRIHADYFPNRQYSVGLDLDANHLISRIYFQDQHGIKTFFTLDQLNDFTTIFEIAGLKLVKIRISEQSAPDAAVIEMSYTTNYLRGTHQSLFFPVHYNPAVGAYEISDARDNRVIHKANVNTRYGMLAPIGISSIETE